MLFRFNMNLVKPAEGFLETLRALCTKHGAVLILDEVMTGFRVGPKGAQGLFGIDADLVTLGKVIGGGMPVGAFGGRRDIMEKIAPLGPVYQAGTLSGSPVALAAGLATLAKIAEPGFYETLSARARQLTEGLVAAAARYCVPFSAQAVGGMFGIYFSARVPRSFDDVMRIDRDAFGHFFHAMLAAGHSFAPSPFEAGFLSIAHSEADIDLSLAAADRVFAELTGNQA